MSKVNFEEALRQLEAEIRTGQTNSEELLRNLKSASSLGTSELQTSLVQLAMEQVHQRRTLNAFMELVVIYMSNPLVDSISRRVKEESAKGKLTGAKMLSLPSQVELGPNGPTTPATASIPPTATPSMATGVPDAEGAQVDRGVGVVQVEDFSRISASSRERRTASETSRATPPSLETRKSGWRRIWRW